MSETGESLVRAAREAAAIARGEQAPERLFIPAEIDVRQIRRRLKLTQEGFAAAYGFTLNQIRDWEQGRSRPLGGARAYLILIDHEPGRTRDTLARAARRPSGAATG